MDLKDICKGIEKAALEAGTFIRQEAEVFDINLHGEKRVE